MKMVFSVALQTLAGLRPVKKKMIMRRRAKNEYSWIDCRFSRSEAEPTRVEKRKEVELR
jgi:hypothetical protein